MKPSERSLSCSPRLSSPEPGLAPFSPLFLPRFPPLAPSPPSLQSPSKAWAPSQESLSSLERVKGEPLRPFRRPPPALFFPVPFKKWGGGETPPHIGAGGVLPLSRRPSKRKSTSASEHAKSSRPSSPTGARGPPCWAKGGRPELQPRWLSPPPLPSKKKRPRPYLRPPRRPSD